MRRPGIRRHPYTEGPMSFSHLSPEQAERAEQILQSLRQATEADLRSLAELLACKEDGQLLGPTRPERAYYHCPHCHRGHCPGDAVIGRGAGALPPGAAQAVSLAGVIVSFAEAADEVLARLAGLRVSEATAQRTT